MIRNNNPIYIIFYSQVGIFWCENAFQQDGEGGERAEPGDRFPGKWGRVSRKC